MNIRLVIRLSYCYNFPVNNRYSLALLFLLAAWITPLWASTSFSNTSMAAVNVISTPTTPLRGGATMNLVMTSTEEKNHNLLIFNQISGNLIKVKAFKATIGSNLVNWDCNQEVISAGLYYWEIRDADSGEITAWGNFAIGKFY